MSEPIDRMLDAVEWVELVEDDAPRPDGELFATHMGKLKIGEFEMRVYQLSNGLRVLDVDDVAEFFGG